jgi:hypothetical protein
MISADRASTICLAKIRFPDAKKAIRMSRPHTASYLDQILDGPHPYAAIDTARCIDARFFEVVDHSDLGLSFGRPLDYREPASHYACEIIRNGWRHPASRDLRESLSDHLCLQLLIPDETNL